MDILEMKASELGGAVGHVAASQLYLAMTDGEAQPSGPRTWFGSDPADEAGIERDVFDMASYVNGRDIPAEQLWRWCMINGIVVIEVDDYHALPVARRLAFEVFTDTCMRAHHRIELAQLDAKRLIPHGDAAPAPGLKLEDSIFEPYGSLGEQEDYQRQFLADQAAADRRRVEEETAVAAAEAAGESQSLGAPIDEQQGKPAGLSAGMKEDHHEEEAAGAGPALGATPAADPGAQGSVPEVADAGLPATPGDDGHEPAGGAADHAPGGAELAGTLAQPPGNEAGADGAADGAHAPLEAEARERGEDVTPPAKGKKAGKGKPTS